MNLAMRWLIVAAVAVLSGAADAQTYLREELRIPAPGTGSRGLEAILVRPDLPGRLPLVVFNHGTPRKAAERRTMTPLVYLPQATEFARRGWAAAIVMRRGYGDSGGDYVENSGRCTSPDYVGAAITSMADLRASILHLQKRPDIDGSRVLVIGQSAGGLAAVALASDPPPGVLAAINFAGGKMLIAADGRECRETENHLVAAFAALGKRARTPMLWIYSENDRLFPAPLAQRFKDAYAAAGGKVEFVAAPAFAADGHNLFVAGISQWIPYVDGFLKQQELVWVKDVLPPPPLPAIAPPPRLSTAGRQSFDKFLAAPPHRAFAVSPSGSYGWQAAVRSVEEARKAALDRCTKHAPDCRVAVIDDEVLP